MQTKGGLKAQKTVRPSGERVIVIGTSDRGSFKRCRRQWDWSSPMRRGLAVRDQKRPLWFGTGMHHALEDYHGLRVYENPQAAIDDYLQATIKEYGIDALPQEYESDIETMKQMLRHYTVSWLKISGRDPLKTYKVKGVPQVEVSFEFEIPLSKLTLERAGADRVVYRGTLDRVVVDDNGYLWVQDYKNIAQFTSHEHLYLDDQIGAYLWAMRYMYKKPCLGFIYTQFWKKGVEPALILKSGEISVDKSQPTTAALYRHALITKYGNGAWPEKHVAALNHFNSFESEESDRFIRRDRITRRPEALINVVKRILMEVEDMLDPQLPIYPSPGFQCRTMCSFVNPCIEKENDDDFEYTLRQDYDKRTYDERHTWKRHLEYGEKTEKPTVQVKGDVPREALR